MTPLQHWPAADRRALTGVFTDIDDTLTTDGAITPDALAALHALQAAGLTVIAITGRPIGWCAPFAQTWPVDAMVAENGAVAFIHNKIGLQATPVFNSLLSKLYQQDASTPGQ
jgi:HAD superfamily hydrolase (TIGR01484 family)